MQHARFASFAIGIVVTLVVGIAVTKVASWWIFSSLFVGTPTVAAGVLVTVVTTRS